MVVKQRIVSRLRVPLALALTVTAAAPALAALTPLEELGKAVFFDTRLSVQENQACASCHAPEAGWTGPDSTVNAGGAVYEGSVPGRFGNRKPPSAAYATTSPLFHWSKAGGGLFIGGNFWDGRATGERLGNPAADQAQGPFVNPAEQGFGDSACVVWKVCTASYPVSMEEVWGAESCAIAWPADIMALCSDVDGPSVPLSEEDRARSDAAYDQIALAVAAYEDGAEVNAFSSKFDQARRPKKQSRRHGVRLNRQERWGFALFMGKGRCNRCHPAAGARPLFTDYSYDNLGLPPNPQNPVYATDPEFVDPGLGGFLAAAGYPEEVVAAYWGLHKVPTLRNVDRRPDEGFVKGYGHNGVFKSLRQIVHFYNTRDVLPTCATADDPGFGVDCWPAPEVEENVNREELGDLGLTPAEEEAIVAFLRTLSDGFQQ